MKDEPRSWGDDHEACWQRGYHGPFVNFDRYRTKPGWEGFGDCVLCGSTCWTDVASHAKGPHRLPERDAP